MSSLPTEGDLFDEKYVIGPVLGIGGMAAVLAAKNLGLDEMVALKVLLPEYCNDATVVERFVQEGKTASKIRSEHVVRTFDAGVAAGRGYIVMEYLRGRDLAVLLREGGPLSVTSAIDFLLQASEAIGEGHALGIIHRDLKPANLFLTHRADGSSCVKVLDFGISRMPLGSDLRIGSQPTLPSVVMGSPQYMSPEQMTSSAAADRRSDVWSLGAILYELLSGQVAFGGATTTEVCARVLAGAPMPLLDLRPDLPEEVCRAIARCLEKGRARRFDNVSELAAALAPFGSESARASATSIARVVEGVIAEGEPPMRVSTVSEPATIKPTAAEILAIPTRERAKLPGLLIASIVVGTLGIGIGSFVLGGAGRLRAVSPVPAAVAVASVAPRAVLEPSMDASSPRASTRRVPADPSARSVHRSPQAAPPHGESIGAPAIDAGAGGDDPHEARPAPGLSR